MTIEKWRIFALTSLSLCLVGCGGSGGSNFVLTGGDTDSGNATISIGISDAPIDDVQEVVIEVDSIALTKEGEDNIVIDSFTSTDLAITDADSFQIDLLDYRGAAQAIVITDLELAAGEYTSIVLSILDGDINNSYVVEQTGDDRKELNVSSSQLLLDNFTVAEEEDDDDSGQTFTLEFSLRKALHYISASDDYLLKSRGIRIQDNSQDSVLSGTVESTLFDDSSCADKDDLNVGNVVFLYEGHDLDTDNLADMFDPDETSDTAPDDAVEPFAVEALVEDGDDWTYTFAYIPAGDYTLAFSCDAYDDDPENYDALEIALPDSQIKELTLSSGTSTVCDLPIDDQGACN